MKFPTTFRRFLGAGTDANRQLGGDVLLVDSAGNPRKANATDENVLTSRIVSVNGWPLSRVVLGAKYTGAGVPDACAVSLFTFEDNLRIWIPLAQSATTITPGTAAAPTGFVFFDACSLIDMNKPINLQNYAPESGSADFLCIVSKGGASPDGQYDFILGPELTTKPF